MKKHLLISLFTLLPLSSISADVVIDESTFPDEVFRSYIKIQSYGWDGVLTDEEISNVTEINLFRVNFKSLKGIEFFTSLVSLRCNHCELSSLDVSGCQALQELYCLSNYLTTLDLSKNINLKTLYCYQNQIKGDGLDALIASLPNANDASIYFYNNTSAILPIYEQNEISTSQVDAAKAKGWTPYKYSLDWVEIEGSKPQITGIEINNQNFPDANFRNFILNNGFGEDGILTEEEISNITFLDASSKNILDLQGVEFFTNLEVLYCGDNKLTSLDMSQNKNLKTLSCYNNLINTLIVSNNFELKSLFCFANKLTSLDVSNNTALISLSCGNNLLTSLDVSKNTALLSLSCDNNLLTSLDASQNAALTELYCANNKLESLIAPNAPYFTVLHCYSNCLNSTAMGYLIDSLPWLFSGRPGNIRVFDPLNDNNVMTKMQSSLASSKYWTPRYLDENGNWLVYLGIDPTSVNNVKSDLYNDFHLYDLNGRKLDGVPTQKGVYIQNGKKVVIK